MQDALESLVAPSPSSSPPQHKRGGSSASVEPSPWRWKTPAVLLLSLIIAAGCLSVDLDPAHPNASKGLLVLLITALWWVTEVVPLVVSAFLPVVLYPLLHVASSGELAHKFFTGVSFMFISGFMVAHGVEHWRLHERALCAITASIKPSAECLVGGCMLAVWSMSMWLPNVFPVLAFLPVAESFLETLPPGHEHFRRGFILAIGWAATCGGLATPVGTPTNGIFLVLYAQFWPAEPDFSFATFTLCALPLSLLLLVCLWLGFCTNFIWRNPEQRPRINPEVFVQKYRSLGKTSWEEIVIGVTFSTLIVLWFTMSPIGEAFPGWKSAVAPGLNAGSVGLAFMLPLFLIPSGRCLPSRARRAIGEERCASRSHPDALTVLEWESAVKSGTLSQLFQLLFVFGGGASLALGTKKSGLASVLAKLLARATSGRLLFFALSTLSVSAVTEMVSNMATLSIFGPVLTATAHHAGLGALQALLAVTLASSFGFMLPMSTGPNLVIFSRGNIPLSFMARQGAYLNVAAIVLGTLYFTYVLPLTLLGEQEMEPIGMRDLKGG